MSSTTMECKNTNICNRAFYATKQKLVDLYDITATGLDVCRRKVENLTYAYLPPTAARIANYMIGALPIAAFWAFTLITPFYISIPLITLYSVTILAKKNDISTKANINIANGNAIGFTLGAVNSLKYLNNVHVHPVLTISFIALNLFFAISSFAHACQLISSETSR